MKSNRVAVVVSGVFAVVLLACGGAPPPPASAGGAPEGGDQVSMGQALYGEKCASCHGAGGEGKDGPAVVGKTALPLDPPAGSKARKNQFHTVADVFEFTHKAMPGDKPGTLTDEQYWAILAFDLKANGVDLGGKKLDATSAPSFVLHP
jgi:cytochrome c